MKWEQWYAWRPIKVVQQMTDPYLKKEDTSLVCYVWLRKVYRIKMYSKSHAFGKWVYCLCGKHPLLPLSSDEWVDYCNNGVHCLKGKNNFLDEKNYRLIADASSGA